MRGPEASGLLEPGRARCGIRGRLARNPGDDEILAIARAEERIIITRDKDFGTLVVRDKLPSCGIVRLVELPPTREADLCLEVLGRHASELARGSLITLDAHRVRLREAE